MIAVKSNSSEMVFRSETAPWGLCAASMMTVGLRWTISHLPGDVALANAERTRSPSNSFSPTKTSTAARAVAAFDAWCSP